MASLSRISSILVPHTFGRTQGPGEVHWAQLGGFDFHKTRGEKKKGKVITFAHNQEIHVNGKLGKGVFV